MNLPVSLPGFCREWELRDTSFRQKSGTSRTEEGGSALHDNGSSPIVQTLETWPLTPRYHLRWGCDVGGQMGVVVEDKEGGREAVLPYRTYLKMELSRRSC